MTDIIGALVMMLVLVALLIGHELWKINRSLKRVARGTEALTRMVAYYWLATPEQRADHAREYQASLDRIRDFLESDAGHEVAQIISGQPRRTKPVSRWQQIMRWWRPKGTGDHERP